MPFTQNDMQEVNSTEGNWVHNRRGHENRDEDISELRHSYQYEETNPRYRERPQYTPYSTDYSPRREKSHPGTERCSAMTYTIRTLAEQRTGVKVQQVW